MALDAMRVRSSLIEHGSNHEQFAKMSISYLVQSLSRAAAIGCFNLLAKFPSLTDRLGPASRLRRLASIAQQSDLSYGGIYSQSTYAPWKGDADFQRIFSLVRSHTLVDEYRCHELWLLCSQIGALERGDLLEIGVWRGGTGCLLAHRCKSTGVEGRVFLCDTFTGVVKVSENDARYVGGEHADTSKAMVLDLITRIGLDNVEVLQGIFPDETGESIADRRFRLCHIDVDVYESAADCFAWVWPRLVPGGIVVFDDYGFYSCGGVTRFVNQMVGSADRLIVYNINGHAVVMKRMSESQSRVIPPCCENSKSAAGNDRRRDISITI
jgi:O-methyltransferase